MVGIRWVQQELLSSLGIEDFDSLGLGSWDFSADAGVEGVIGLGEGEDFEEEVDKEIRREGSSGGESALLKTLFSSRAGSPKRIRFGAGEVAHPLKKRKVAKPEHPESSRTIKDVWPAFEPGIPLNFTQMLRYKVEHKPRTHYHPLPTGKQISLALHRTISPDASLSAEGDGLTAPSRPLRRLLPKTINLKETSNGMSSALYAEELALFGSFDPKGLTDAALRRALKV